VNLSAAPIALSDPGIDDSRNELLWSPATPTLIQTRLRLVGGRAELIDEVESYTALRSISVEGDRLVLNGRPYMLRIVLDEVWRPVANFSLTTRTAGFSVLLFR
jgi:hypothetical protein